VYRKDLIWLYSAGVVTLLLTGYLAWGYVRPEWKDYQDDFHDLVAEKFGPQKAVQVPRGLQQVWLKDLHRVDRCTTCHQGIEWKGLDSGAHPFKSHPKEILQKHPVETVGCTPCHGGQGYATDQRSAHGMVEHWEEPLL
jgi:hypothetical protein